MLDTLRLKRAFRRLNRELEGIRPDLSGADLLNFVYSKPGSLITPWQYREEVEQLVAELEKLKPARALEIGTANGGTLFLLCRLAESDARIMSIDLPEGKFGGGYPEWKIPMYHRFATSDQELELLRGDSHRLETLQRVETFFQKEELDYLFIDGDHSYEGVKQDYEMYSPLVRKGGLIVFHDIVEHPDSDCQVDRYWHEVKEGKNYKEFVRDWEQGKYGIGLIIKD